MRTERQREQQRKASAKYRASHPPPPSTPESREANRIKSARYRAAHPERIKEATKISNLKRRSKPGYKEKAAAYLRKLRERDPVPNREAVKRYRASHPEMARIGAHNRRAKIAACGGRLSVDVVAILMEKQRGLCTCCGAILKNTGFHIDHIIPLSRGGKNEMDNVQLLTPMCNWRKHNRLPEEIK